MWLLCRIKIFLWRRWAYSLYLPIIFICIGDYAGFDEKEPTSKNGGKAEVINMLKEKYGYTKLFMIGDGITDLEASPPADAFIGKLLNFYFILNRKIQKYHRPINGININVWFILFIRYWLLRFFKNIISIVFFVFSNLYYYLSQFIDLFI